MKDPQSQYFGISLVQLLGGGFPVLRIQSGITSPHQASAYSAEDGRSVWELQPNNQLKLLRGGNYCLSQMGSKAGSSDVAKNSEVHSSHSRAADNEHGPSSAVDGKDSTYWASQEFQKDALPEAVLFDVDLGDKYKLRTTDIDWEYPPFSYSIAASLDGVNYAEISRNDVNTLYTTLDDMKAVIAQYLRIRLEKPHPTMGVLNGMFLYGIKTLSVYSNRLRSIVEPCPKAKASADARDKFFLELVTEIDLSAGIELRRAGQIAASASGSMTKNLSAVAEISEPIKTCFEGKEAATLKLAALDAEVVDALGNLAVFEEASTSLSESAGGATASNSMRGLSKEHPVEDCYTLKTLYNKVTSGFYWVLPLCASQPLRAYCDISSGGTYATIPDNDNIVSLHDAVMACATVGGNAAFDVDEAKVVGGEAGVYAEDSSICIAAIHAGLLSRGGDVSIRISPTPAEFEGTDKNGILSSSYFGHTDKRAFVVEAVAKQCPMDQFHSSSFLELGISRSAEPPRENGGWPKLMSLPMQTTQQPNAAPSQALSAAPAQSSPISEEMNELTVMAINQLSTILSQQLGGLNMEVVEHVKLTATKVSSTAMHIQKALAVDLGDRQSPVPARSSSPLRLPRHDYRWTLGTPRIGKRGGHQSLCQSSAVTPTVPGSSGTGTYSIVKNKSFYDFVLNADVYISGSGSVGVAFRVKDRKNMFLFEMKQQGNGGLKRLLRIVNGVPTETAKLEDGGYVEGIWYHVEVRGQLQRISVRVSEISENAPAAASRLDIDLLDGSFMSGSIGFYTSAVNSACFDKVVVTPLPCVGNKEKALLPPYPPRCSNYRESVSCCFSISLLEAAVCIRCHSLWVAYQRNGTPPIQL
ncbi:hypothetical protein Emed_000227 [Eimeria media]